MALIPMKISQLLAVRSINTSPLVSKPPVTRSCNCPQETPPPKKGMMAYMGGPFGKTCGTCPCPGKPKGPSNLWKVCMFGVKSGIAGGLVYWTYHKGMWSNSERSEEMMDRLKSAGTVLVYGASACDPAMGGGCCENCKDENEVLQRLKTAYCFLKLENTVQPIVEDAVYVGTLGDDDDFCRCEICEPVTFLRKETSGGGPEPKPSEEASTSSADPEQCEEPSRGEWIWNKWSSQNWSPKTCIFSKQCACGDKTEAAASTPESDESPQEEDNNYYMDEYFIIRKEEDEGKQDDQSAGGKDGKGADEGGASEAGADEGGADDGGAGEEAAGEEEGGEEEAA